MASYSTPLSRIDGDRFTLLRRVLLEFLLFAAIGIELMVLVAWIPDTLDVWFRPDTAGYGDFPIFYRQAQGFSLNATYSPGLGVLMHPLAHFSMRDAFMIYTGVNVAAVLGIAYVAQRSVTSLPAKAAVALGVLALPQMHWAIRVGHFMPVLALATLCGMILAERRPIVAGLLIGVLALKPQYLPVPVLYFLWSRNWRALLSSTGTLFALGVAGVGAAVWKMGPDVVPYTVRHYTGSVGYIAHHLTAGQQDQIYVQGWQYSWYGFLTSAGIDPNPLLAVDLMLLSLVGVVLAWWKCTPSVARVATVLGMLLLLPHSTFYNWSLISVAGVLLLRSDLRPRYLVPMIIAGCALAAAATQNATLFPVPVDLYRPAATRGLYWIQPAALAALFTIAIAGRRAAAASAAPAAVRTVGHRRWSLALASLSMPALQRASVFAAAVVIGVSSGYAGGAFVSGSGPFRNDPYFARRDVLSALPGDFPVPPAASVDRAGPGTHLPYRVEWRSPDAKSAVAGLMRARLADGTWRIVDTSDDGTSAQLRSTRSASSGGLPFIAEVAISAAGGGSRVSVEFSPLPASTVPGYQRWLESRGIIVHNVDPGLPTPDLARP
jgi:hypothetical protein